MKMLNNIKIADDVLYDVLVKAGRAVGVKTGKVLVQVNKTIYGCHGRAFDCRQVRWDRSKKRIGSRRWINCKGAFKIWLSPTRPALDTAKSFYNMARHEFGHIRDYHEGRYGLRWSHASPNGRRPAWKHRPEEVRAEDYIYWSDKKKRSADDAFASKEITAMAVALEEYQKAQGWKP